MSQKPNNNILKKALEDITTERITNNHNSRSTNNINVNLVRTQPTKNNSNILSQALNEVSIENDSIQKLKSEINFLKEKNYLLLGQVNAEKAKSSNSIEQRNNIIQELKQKISLLENDLKRKTEALETEIKFLNSSLHSQNQRNISIEQINCNLKSASQTNATSFIGPVPTKSIKRPFNVIRNEFDVTNAIKKKKINETNCLSKSIQCKIFTGVNKPTQTINLELPRKSNENNEINQSIADDIDWEINMKNADCSINNFQFLCSQIISQKYCCTKTPTNSILDQANKTKMLLGSIINQMSNHRFHSNIDLSQNNQVDQLIKLVNLQAERLCIVIKQRVNPNESHLTRLYNNEQVSLSEITMKPTYHCAYYLLYPIQELICVMRFLIPSNIELITTIVNKGFIQYLMSTINYFSIEYCEHASVKSNSSTSQFHPINSQHSIQCQSFLNRYEAYFVKNFLRFIIEMVDYQTSQSIKHQILVNIGDMIHKLVPFFKPTCEFTIQSSTKNTNQLSVCLTVIQVLQRLLLYSKLSICNCTSIPNSDEENGVTTNPTNNTSNNNDVKPISNSWRCYLLVIIKLMNCPCIKQYSCKQLCSIIHQIYQIVSAMERKGYQWQADSLCTFEMYKLLSDLTHSFIGRLDKTPNELIVRYLNHLIKLISVIKSGFLEHNPFVEYDLAIETAFYSLYGFINSVDTDKILIRDLIAQFSQLIH